MLGSISLSIIVDLFLNTKAPTVKRVGTAPIFSINVSSALSKVFKNETAFLKSSELTTSAERPSNVALSCAIRP